jgi:hypothetical protein
MKDYTTEAWMTPLVQKIEEHISTATAIYQNLPEEQLLTAPAPGSWSVAQCLEHLNSYGDYYLPAVERALVRAANSQLKSTHLYRSGWLGSYFIQMMKPGNKKKYKAFKGHLPAPELNGPAVVAEFIRQQEEWLRLMDRIDDVTLLNVRVPISISPLVRLKLGDVLGFVKAHDDRHITQANRVLAWLREAV